MKNWQTYNYTDLEAMLAKHRQQAFITCDEKCFCWEVEKFLYQQEAAQQSVHPTRFCVCGEVIDPDEYRCPSCREAEYARR